MTQQASDDGETDGVQSPEILLFGGKGGVGKTTCAAAAGYGLANRGERTLIVSTDPAHSLSDVFETEIGSDETQLDDNLYGVEVDPVDRFQRQYSDKFQDMLETAQSFGLDISSEDVDDIASEGILPGADELAVIDLFGQYIESDEWDYVVFDTAPTGHTLRLIQLPDVMDSMLGKLLKIKSSADRVTGMVSSVLNGGGGDDDEFTLESDVDTMQDRVERVSEVLQDGDRTSFNVVTLPEELPLEETKRLLAQLDGESIRVGHVFVNKVLIEYDADCNLCSARHEDQQNLLDSVRGDIEPPLHELPLLAGNGYDTRADRMHRMTEELPIEDF